MINTAPARYDRSVLLHAYIDAVRAYSAVNWKTGAEAEAAYANWDPRSVAYATARKNYLAGLEKLFDVDLGLPDPLSGSDEVRRRVVLRFMRRAAQDYDAIRRPFDGYLEAGLLVKSLEEVGVWDAVSDCNARMEHPAAGLREQYLTLLDVLLRGLLSERADAVFELDDPLAAHIVVPPPWED